MRIQQPVDAPDRTNLDWAARWQGPDSGVIAAWEAGRVMARSNPDLANAARAGELVVLPFKGGVRGPLKLKTKAGPLWYLAMWQGLRAEPLDIDTEQEVTLTCSRHAARVTFTPDASKYTSDTT